MDHIEFGKQLFDTYDLDPLYVILATSGWSNNVMYRFLLAYWVFYSVGVACECAQYKGAQFYNKMRELDAEHAPRGHERRHMRGQAFVDCVNGLQAHGTPEQVVRTMTHGTTFRHISDSVQHFRGFGPWISWKIADMTERVLGQPVDFSVAEIGVYKDPVKGAALIRFGDQKHPITRAELHETFDNLLTDFDGYTAPPYCDRPINIQELETVACKYKSHVNGHYPPGNDTIEIMHGLAGRGPLASQLAEHLKPYYQIWRS